MLTSLTSFVQRIGRAGRAGQESYATLVLRGDDPISAHYARNPEDYLSDLEPAYVEPDNQFVSYYQILAMLLDKPLNQAEKSQYSKYLEPLIENNKIGSIKGNIIIKDRSWAQKELQNYSIRGIGNSVMIFHNDNKIGERILPMALRELHEGAIYLHGGKSYKVNKYNQKLSMARLVHISSNHEKTQALRSISPEILSINFEAEINGLAAIYAKIKLTETVYGYSRNDIFTNKVLGMYNLDDPISYSFDTMGFILALPKPEKFVEGLDPKLRIEKLGGTFHAVEHVLIESGNSLTGGGSNQIGGIAMGDTGSIFVYDGTEGGSGLSKLLFDSLEKGLNRSLRILQDCVCGREDGCPRCTYSYQCGNNNQPLNRLGAIETLKQFGNSATELDLNFSGVESFVAYPDYYINYY
jgi:DEAD/DEAH box helicase domain-containing protein